MQVQTTTIPNVELLAAGSWNSGQGPVTIDAAWLDSVVAASQDPAVDRAPLKLGHYDPMNRSTDGTPAFGWVRNVRRVADKIVGDIVDVPVKLAAIAKVAYKRRSAELRRDVVGTGGKVYPIALSGVALLGAQPPAVKGLADLEGLFFDAPEVVGALTIETATLSEGTTRHDGGAPTLTEGAIPMDPKKLRVLLSLAEDATDEQVEQALSMKLSAAPTLPEGVVAIDAGVLTELRSQAALGAAAAATLLAAKVDQTLDVALSEGRIAPTSVDTWRKRLTDDFDVEVVRLSELVPGMAMPTVQRGGRIDLAQGSKDPWTDDAINFVTGGHAGRKPSA